MSELVCVCLSLCVCVCVCVRSGHYIIVSLRVKNSPVRPGADLLGAVQSKDITVGLFSRGRRDLLTLYMNPAALRSLRAQPSRVPGSV